jgi:hypothetical protein
VTYSEDVYNSINSNPRAGYTIAHILIAIFIALATIGIAIYFLITW